MTRRDPLYTVANLLSLSRLPLAALFWPVLRASWGGPWPALVVLALAALTDLFDGIVARRALARESGGQATGTPAGAGSWLDPICDKLFVATVLAAIWSLRHPSLGVLALIVSRELAQLPLSVIYLLVPALRRWLRYDFRASALGKAATVLQLCAVVLLLFGSPAAPLFAVVTFVVGMLALGDYVTRAVSLGRARLAAGERAAAAAPGDRAR